MCDDDIHPGIVQTGLEPKTGVSRRALGLTALAAGAAAAAAASAAEADVVETEVSVKTPDGVSDSVLFHPAKGTHPAVLGFLSLVSTCCLKLYFRLLQMMLSEGGTSPNPRSMTLQAWLRGVRTPPHFIR